MYCGVLHFVSNWFCKKNVQNLNPQQLGYWSYGRTSTPGQVHALWTFSTLVDGDYHSQDGCEEAPQGLPHPSTCDFIPRTQSGQIGSQHRGNWFSSHLKGQDRGQKGISCFPQSQGPEHCILPLLLVLGGQFVWARSGVLGVLLCDTPWVTPWNCFESIRASLLWGGVLEAQSQSFRAHVADWGDVSGPCPWLPHPRLLGHVLRQEISLRAPPGLQVPSLWPHTEALHEYRALRWVQPVTPQLQVCKPSEGWLPWNTDSWIRCHKMFAPMYHTHTVSSCDIEGYPFLVLATCRDVNYNLISYFVDNSNLSNYLLNKIWGNINVIV